jgi:hypothetical protein
MTATIELMSKKVIETTLSELTDFNQEYIELCEKIGCNPPKVLMKLKLLKVLTDLNLLVYDYESVRKHLNKIAKDTEKKLKTKRDNREKVVEVKAYWHPLRKSDLDQWVWKGGTALFNKPYDKPVPYEILQDVEKVTKHFEKGIIAISDFRVSVSNPPKLDPFVKVKAYPDHPGYIFGMWDEPGYRIKFDLDALIGDVE